MVDMITKIPVFYIFIAIIIAVLLVEKAKKRTWGEAFSSAMSVFLIFYLANLVHIEFFGEDIIVILLEKSYLYIRWIPLMVIYILIPIVKKLRTKSGREKNIYNFTISEHKITIWATIYIVIASIYGTGIQLFEGESLFVGGRLEWLICSAVMIMLLYIRMSKLRVKGDRLYYRGFFLKKSTFTLAEINRVVVENDRKIILYSDEMVLATVSYLDSDYKMLLERLLKEGLIIDTHALV